MIRNARAITVLFAGLVMAITFVAGSLPASATADHASGPHAQAQLSVTYTPLCEKDSPYLCWRDLSDGGLGTRVVVSGYGTDNARSWYLHTDYARCGGTVSNANACPFTPGSGLNFDFNNDRIVYVQNANGYCAGSSSTDGGFVFMHSCDSVGGVSELASVFVEEKFSGHFRLVSVVQSDICLCHTFVNGGDYDNYFLYVSAPTTWARWVGAGSGF